MQAALPGCEGFVVCLMQNRVGELYSLVRYLRIFPFAYYFCHKAPKAGEARCNCHCLDYPFKACSRECLHCG